MARCLVGCGSNLGQRRDLLDRAIELLRFMPGVTVLQTSHFHESKAVGGPVDQPAFLNGACLLETDLQPRELLGTLQAVENTLERQRDVHWGPRTIDLDLLLYDTLQLDHDDLTVPHPRMTTRRFVLEPCVEIAPDFLHPSRGCSLRDLLDNISRPHRRIAICGVPGSGTGEVASAVADATVGHAFHGSIPLARALAQPDPRQRLELSLAAAECWHSQLPPARNDSEWQTNVSDYWLGSLATLNQETIDAAPCDLGTRLQKRIGACPAPHVLIVLRISADAIEERIRFCRGPFAGGSDVFADLEACLTSPHSKDTDQSSWRERLLSAQEQLLAAVGTAPHVPAWLPIPKGVVLIDADDLGEATHHALAAVEAMA